MAWRGLIVVGCCAASAAYYLPSRDRSLSLSAAASHPSCLLLPARIVWSGSGCVVASGPGPASVQKGSPQERPLRAPCRDL